uniref:Fucolectin tachylectin-4 pentraxin-1 domain-containing protein n=2 Tax=Sparus aurata TaxID=8175 RepID=A0A671TWY8_SPAAU
MSDVIVVLMKLGGKVAQSSPYGKAVPERAIDGSRASNWHQGSCTHTQKDKNPWWRLDLLRPYKVNTVTITNRKDCCHKRINGAEIRIGNSLENNGNLHEIGSKTFECRGMEGRFVNIVIPGRREFLTLCEVEVTGQPYVINIARGGKVAQSSPHGKVVPERAIDGSRASNWHQGSCTHTQKDKNPWWRLDLLRINGAEIRIGYSLENYGNANPRCAVITSIPAGESKTFECRGMEGRYVNIVIPGRREFLTLCEVEVTGQPYGKKAPLVICNI